MARKPSTTNPEAAPAAELRSDVVEVSNVLASIQADYSEERDLVNQLLGQVQMARSFARFADVVSLSKLKHIKENKLYRALAGKKGVDPDGNEIADVGTFDGFCQAIGLSRSKVDEDLTNLTTFGEEALKHLSAIGAGYRELRQFRKLPEDQKTALIEVAKSGDKESFVELAEEIITKHAKEKEALTKRAENAEADLEARSRLLEDKNGKIDQLTEEMAKVKKRVKSLPPAQVGEEIRQEVVRMASMAEVSIRAMRAGLQALADHTAAHEMPHGEFMSGVICQLELALNQLRGEFDIKESPNGDNTPEWALPDVMSRLETENQTLMHANGWQRDVSGNLQPIDTGHRAADL
ncbi:hypothetical protein [Vogesella sp. XCS3]|uniref:hypothetical protein n=1 Tax=Vogesella sp. XCS3 TaxID=2877939 RepID=UPI001D0AF61E|nr:hypothetical protein [Vogesella sp. XCS3]UDM15864.1 hypothetical protein LCH97_11150 [Vogesella sp. XCS3]